MKRAPEEGVTWQQLELMRQWGASLLLVARQEMEHLGLVCNLLTAIGEAPTLRRPDFPLGPRYYDLGIPCLLEPFGLPALERFIGFEAPETVSGEDLARFEQNRAADARHLLHRRALRRDPLALPAPRQHGPLRRPAGGSVRDSGDHPRADPRRADPQPPGLRRVSDGGDRPWHGARRDRPDRPRGRGDSGRQPHEPLRPLLHDVRAVAPAARGRPQLPAGSPGRCRPVRHPGRSRCRRAGPCASCSTLSTRR